jgi:hypothetical protein
VRSHQRSTPTTSVYGRPAANVVQAAAGRTCAAPDCTTKLSRYNAESTCSPHGGWARALRGARS